MHRLLIACVCLFVATVAQAQDAPCESALDRAKAAFVAGKVKDVGDILTEECLKVIPPENIQDAYYLLCTSSLFLNEKEKATEQMLKLLHKVPEFHLQPHMSLEFRQFYEGFKVSPIVVLGLKMGSNATFASPLKSYSMSNLVVSNDVQADLGTYAPRYGFQVGLLCQIPLPIFKRWEAGAEPTFRLSGYQYKNSYLKFVNLTFTETQTYLELPLYLKYNFRNKYDFSREKKRLRDKLYPYISVGAMASYLYKSTGKAIRVDKGDNGDEPVSLESLPQDLIEKRYTFKVMPMAAAGLEYKSGRGILAFELRYTYMLDTQVKPGTRYSNQELIFKYMQIDNDFRLHNLTANISFAYPLYHARVRKQKGTVIKPKIIDINHTE